MKPPPFSAARVRAIAADYLPTPEKLNDEARLIADVGADSLDMTEVQIALEDEFDVSLPDDFADLENLTLGELIAMVERLYVSTHGEKHGKD